MFVLSLSSHYSYTQNYSGDGEFQQLFTYSVPRHIVTCRQSSWTASITPWIRYGMIGIKRILETKIQKILKTWLVISIVPARLGDKTAAHTVMTIPHIYAISIKMLHCIGVKQNQFHQMSHSTPCRRCRVNIWNI